MKLDILAFGAHPDDVELGCSGVLMMAKLQGKHTGVVDLTMGELGTRGTIQTRHIESIAATTVMQLDVRENLELPDGFFQNEKEHQLEVIRAIRKYQPEIILCNAPSDRHPDHGRGARLLQEASFLSGLRKVETTEDGILQEPWKPKYVFSYIQDRYLQPNFVFDITAVIDRKIGAIKAYSTQFDSPDKSEPQTYISTPDFLESIIYRAKMFGKMIGVPYAEGFISDKMIGISSFDALVQHIT
ncbi:MAG: bacillithiol biosynthesis deacetylase BshB1 [Chitinophagaceae bacterium]